MNHSVPRGSGRSIYVVKSFFRQIVHLYPCFLTFQNSANPFSTPVSFVEYAVA